MRAPGFFLKLRGNIARSGRKIRRLLVPDSCVLDDLHSIIQGISLWEQDHMWVFLTPAGDIPPMNFEEPKVVPAKALDPGHVTLKDVFDGKKKPFEYEYDFGDSWIHKITLEKRLPAEPGVKYPVADFCKAWC